MIEVVKRGSLYILEDTYKVDNNKSNGDLINRKTTGKRGKYITYRNVTKKNRGVHRKMGGLWLKIGVFMGKVGF